MSSAQEPVAIAAVVGVPFELELGSAPTTGYTWEPAGLPDGLRLLERGFRVPEGAAIGDGGTLVLRLQADRPGRFELRLDLRRRWEGEADALERRTFVVEAG